MIRHQYSLNSCVLSLIRFHESLIHRFMIVPPEVPATYKGKGKRIKVKKKHSTILFILYPLSFFLNS